MKVGKKLLSMLLWLCLVSVIPISGLALDRSGDKVIKGTTDVAKVPVSIFVVEYADRDTIIRKSNVKDVVKFMWQAVSDEKGVYSISVTGLETKKKYTARIVENNSVEEIIDFYCPSTAERLAVYDEIESLDKESNSVYEDIASIIEDNEHILGWSTEIYNSLEDKAKTASEVIDLCASNTSGSSMELAFDELMVALKTYQTELHNQKVTALNNVNTKSWDKIRDVLNGNQDCLKGLNSNGYGLLYEFNSEDFTSLHEEYQTEICQELANVTYEDLKAFVEASNKAVKEKIAEAEEDNNNNKGNSSSGGGGGGTKIVSSTKNEEQENIQNVPFNDLSSVNWAKEGIVALYNKGIISGVGDNRFAPNDPVTREQFLKMLILATGTLDSSASATFDDVPESHWSYPYIASAYKAGITTGISAKEFGKSLTLSRQDAATFACRVLRYLSVKPEAVNRKTDFTDSADIAEYARESVELLQISGVINGMDDGRFAPIATLTRAQAAKIIYDLVRIIDIK